MNLLDVIATLLGCEKAALHDYLNHPIAEKKITDYLNGRKLRTTYLSRIGEQKTIKFGGFSSKSSMIQPAYEGFLGITVQQHFYCRHRIRLMYPRLKCIVEYGPKSSKKYYPIELLEIYEDDGDTVQPNTNYKLDWVNDNSEWYSIFSSK